MPWVLFKENFDWQPEGARWMIAYRAGAIHLVKQAAAAAAIAAGKAEPTERPPRRLIQGGYQPELGDMPPLPTTGSGVKSASR